MNAALGNSMTTCLYFILTIVSIIYIFQLSIELLLDSVGSVIRFNGGRFMKMYFSGVNGKQEVEYLREAGADTVLVDQFDLRHGAGFKSIAIDSGAYRAMKGKTSLSLADYIDFLGCLNFSRFDFILSLDVIGDAEQSFKNWKEVCSRYPVIPVFHYESDLSYLDRYVESEPAMIAIGALALPMRTKDRQGAALDFLCRILDQYPCGFHFLGLNWLKAIQTLKVHPRAMSFDTSKFLDGGRYRHTIFIDERNAEKGPQLRQAPACKIYKREVDRGECIVLCAQGLIEYMSR
jgi:hypothetical protein